MYWPGNPRQEQDQAGSRCIAQKAARFLTDKVLDPGRLHELCGNTQPREMIAQAVPLLDRMRLTGLPEHFLTPDPIEG